MELATQIEKLVVDLKGMSEDELYNFYGDNNTLVGYGILRVFPRVVRYRVLNYVDLLKTKLHYEALECPSVAKWLGRKAAAELGLIRKAVRQEMVFTSFKTACETVVEPSTVVDPSHGSADSHVQAYELECMTRQRQIDVHREYDRYSEACMVCSRIIEPELGSAYLCCGCIDSGYAIFWHEGTPTVLPSDITAAYAHLETAYTHFDTLLDDNINLSDAEWGIFDSCESWVSYRL